MRRLVAKHQGAFPASALVKIWRELLSGTVRVQTPFSVAVSNGKDPILYHGLVRDQFSGAPVRHFPRPDDAIRNVVDGDAMVAVVPIPSQETAESWWSELAFGKYQSLKILGRLPFLKTLKVGGSRGPFGCVTFAPSCEFGVNLIGRLSHSLGVGIEDLPTTDRHHR